jgi:phenylalanyl-tRNA synthetase beta chain
MRASLRWLRELVDLPDDAAEVAEALDLLGIEVESMEELALPFSGVVVARVLSVAAHPDADRLRVVSIDHGGGEATVVCGAWNFDAGDIVAYAPPGSRLAGGLEVGEREIRGVASPGMICSEAELGLGEDADGIMVVDHAAAKVGSDLSDAVPLPDVVFDVSITSNRPDLMSMHGLARELAALFETEARMPEVAEIAAEGPSGVRVVVDAPDRCPRFTAREIRGVTVGPSPLWMRTRLRAVGVRPISNIVDITNYVMLELGQPLHAFDLDRIGDATVVVRTATEGEGLTTLDGEDRVLRDVDLVIADSAHPMGLAGVMGGEATEVSESTTGVLLEAAHFRQAGVLFTSKHHRLRSEASARFERGVDPELPPLASHRAAALIVEYAGGTPVGALIDVQAAAFEPPVVALPPSEVERLLGVAVPADEVRSILERLGFAVEGAGPFTVTVPSHRPDVTRRADLVEEVARLYGFDRIPERLPKGPGEGLPPWERARRRLRETLIGAGYFEVLSLDFVAAADIASMGFDPSDRRGRPLRLRNPLSDEQAHLRTTLLPGLGGGLRVNAMRNRHSAALFEIGSVFLESEGAIPDQPRLVAFASTGESRASSWEPARERDAHDAVGVIETVFGAFDIDYELVPGVVPGMHPGRGAEIVVDGAVVGFVGEIHPDVAAAWGLTGRVTAGEMDTAVFESRGVRAFRTPSPLPPVVFDLAFDIADDVPAARLLDAVRGAAGPRLERIVVFDVFSGAPLEPGRRSIAVRLTFRDPERTLTDDDLAPVRDEIAVRVAAEVHGRLRGGST